MLLGRGLIRRFRLSTRGFERHRPCVRGRMYEHDIHELVTMSKSLPISNRLRHLEVGWRACACVEWEPFKTR